ncbi:hypothetical protein WMY93_016903 [Mugilogobius chulae]|uniref:CARD domain-containing protein n=1 Tax=Mugilogobius chulae TaxID=88201 RepID=A0AAW0NTS5_9GOBI
MSESRPEYVVPLLEDFREEIIARVAHPEAIIEAWMSQELVSEEERTAITAALTPTDQLRALFVTVAGGTPQMQTNFYHLLKEKESVLVTELEQRCYNNKVTQTELTWTQAEPEINIKSKKEKIVRQKQLVNEIIRETQTIWKDRQVEKEAFHILNKATRLAKEIEQLWETMEHEEMEQKLKIEADKHYIEELHSQVQQEKREVKLDRDRQVAKAELDELNNLRVRLEKQNEELDEKLCQLKTQVREIEATSTEAALRKTDLVKTMKKNRKKEADMLKMKEEIEKDTNTQVKWINFQIQKKERHLDRRLERTMRERDELDIVKSRWSMSAVAKVKDGMKTTVEELDSTKVEMKEVQKEARENQEQVKRYVELLKDLKVKVDRWIARENQRKPIITDEFTSNEQEYEEIKSQIAELMDEEETMRGEIRSEMENMEVTSKDIKQLIKEIHELQNLDVKPFDASDDQSTAQSQEETSGLIQKTLHTFRRTFTSIWGRKEETTIIQETDKQTEECESIEPNDEEEYSANDIQRLREELCATIDVIRSVKLELMPEAEDCFVEEDFVPSAGIEELLQEMKDFQEVLFVVKDDINNLKEDLSNIKTFKITAKKQRRNLDQRLEKTLRERDELDILKLKVQRQQEALQLKIEKQQAKELDIRRHMTKKEIREMEVLKAELEVRRRESEQAYRKATRKGAELENMWNQIREERDSLRRESAKKKRELEQRLERTMRERDELEIMKMKVQRQREELSGEMEVIRREKESIQNQLALIQQHEERTHVGEIRNEKIYVKEFVSYFQNVKTNIDRGLERITVDIAGILKSVKVDWQTHWEDLQELQSERKKVRDKLDRIKSQLQVIAEQKQGRSETEEICKQKAELDLERAKNERMVKSAIEKEEEVKALWAELQREKEALEMQRLEMLVQKKKENFWSQIEAEIEKEKQRIQQELWKQVEKQAELPKAETAQETNVQDTEQESGSEKMNLMEQDKQSIKEEMELLGETKAEMENKRQYVDELLDEISREKGRVKDLSLQISQAKEKVGRIRLTEQKDKEEDQEEMKMALVAEVKQFSDLIRALNVMKEEAEKAIIHIREENEQRNKIRRDVEGERQMLVQEMKRVTEQLPLLGISLKEKCKDVMVNRNEDFKLIEQKQKTVEKLYDRLQNNQAQLKLLGIKMAECVEQFGKNKQQIMSQVDKDKGDVTRTAIFEESPLESEILERKAELERTMTNLHQMEKDIQSSLNDINTEKENFKVLASQVQEQKATFENIIAAAEKQKGKRGNQQTEMMKIKLSGITEQMCGNVKEKLTKLDRQSEDLQRLNVSVKQTWTYLNEKQQQVEDLTETLHRKSSKLPLQKKELESTVQLDIMPDIKDLDKLTTQLKQERESLNKEKEKLARERMELEVKRADDKRESDLIERLKQHSEKTQVDMDTVGIETVALPERLVNMRENQLPTVKQQTQRILSNIANKMERIENLRIMFEQKQALLEEQKNVQSLHGVISSIVERKRKESEEVIDDTLGKEFSESQRITASSKSVNTLEQIKQSFRIEQDGLRQALSKLQENKESFSSLLAETSKEKSHVQTLADLVQKEKVRFQNILRNMQKTHQDKSTQTQEETTEVKISTPPKQDAFGTRIEKCLELENKMEQLQKDESVLKVCDTLEKKCMELKKEKQNITGLSGKISDILKHIHKKKEELKATEIHVEEQSIVPKQEQVRSDISQEYAALKKHNEDVAKLLHKLEADREELQNKKETMNLLCNEIKTEQNLIKDLASDVQNVKKSIDNSMESSNIQEIQNLKETFDEEKKELELAKQNLNRTTEETEAAMRSIYEETKKLEEMKMSLNKQGKMSNPEEKKEMRFEDVQTATKQQTRSQVNLFERHKDDVMKKIHQVQKTSTDVLRQRKLIEGLLKETHSEKANMRDMASQIHSQRQQLEKVINKLKLWHSELDRQQQEINISTDLLEKEREHVEEMRKHLDTAMISLGTEKEQLKEERQIMKDEEIKQLLKLQTGRKKKLQQESAGLEKKKSEVLAEKEFTQIEELEFRINELETQVKELQQSNELLKKDRKQVEETMYLERIRQENENAMSLINEEKKQLQESRRKSEHDKEQVEALMEEVKRRSFEAEAAKSWINQEKQKLLKMRAELDIKRQEVENQKDKLRQN